MLAHKLSAVSKGVFVGALLLGIVTGLSLTTTTARAASSDALITESLPRAHATTQLVLGELMSRISAEPQLLASASTNDAQIAALMKLLEELIKIYQGLLAAQGGSVTGDDSTDERSAYGGLYIDITDPIGGETVTVGAKDVDFRVRWNANVTNKRVQVYLKLLDGRTCFMGSTQVEKGNFPIVIGKGYTCPNISHTVRSGKYSVALSIPDDRYGVKGIYDSTDPLMLENAYGNTESSITVTYPNGGETITTNDKDINFRVNWTSSNLSGRTYVYLNGIDGSMCLLGSTMVSKGTFGTNINLNTKCQNIEGYPSSGRYKVVLATDTVSPTGDMKGINDSSDGYFTLNVIGQIIEESPSITVISPNGGETYTVGESVIRIKYRSSGIVGETLTAYLYSPESGNRRSVNGYAQDSGTIEMHLAKGDTVDSVGNYKITLCAHGVITDGKDFCDTSDGYFTLTSTGGTDSVSVSSSFSYRQQYDSDTPGRMNVDYTYTIQNYRSGLVLDVEPRVNCDDTYIAPLRRDCSQYVFTLSGKAAESYTNVQGDPYVKGGALYRFTGANGQLYITGNVNSSYYPVSPNISPTPDNIDFRFILRDLNQGGKEIWSETKTAQFKG